MPATAEPVAAPAGRAGPPRATHPKLRRALARLRSSTLADSCAAPAPADLRKAIHEFNEGAFFEQHETLELLWRATPGDIRHLYEGILQVGVGMHHLLVNRNFHGAAVKLDHGIRLLGAFPSVCHGVDVERLRRDARRARLHLLRLGPDRLADFDPGRVPRVHFAEQTDGAVANPRAGRAARAPGPPQEAPAARGARVLPRA